MEPEIKPTWEEEHPWLASADEEDSIDDVTRFALDELRFE